jgi:hypothetical protein
MFDSYRDFSSLTEEGVRKWQMNHTGHLGVGDLSKHNFPPRLHYVLTEIEHDAGNLSEVAAWQPHGRCFVVKDQKRFTEEILKRYFCMTHYSSFQRQLNLYGFHRISAGKDKGAYWHECFLRGKPFLTHHIRRQKIKGTGPRQASTPENEPDFYKMPFLPPSTTVGLELPIFEGRAMDARSAGIADTIAAARATLRAQASNLSSPSVQALQTQLLASSLGTPQQSLSLTPATMSLVQSLFPASRLGLTDPRHGLALLLEAQRIQAVAQAAVASQSTRGDLAPLGNPPPSSPGLISGDLPSLRQALLLASEGNGKIGDLREPFLDRIAALIEQRQNPYRAFKA